MLNPDYSTFDYIYLSLGAGVQSTALYLLSSREARGLPRADVAIFADTQDEPGWVYENLERLRAWAKENDGIPIEVVTNGCLGDHLTHKKGNAMGDRFASIPGFTRGDDGRAAPLRRQCTREYKITPIEKKVRELMGYKPRQVIKGEAAALVGISIDEVSRLSDSRTRWVETCFPLVDARIDRFGCLRIVEEHGLPQPQKSSCVYCPYHSDRFWRNLRDNHPEEWGRACEIDETIRDMSKAGVARQVFLHRSLIPLAEIQVDDGQGELFDMEHGACDGFCDT